MHQYLPIKEEREIALYVLDEERYAEAPQACLDWFGADGT